MEIISDKHFRSDHFTTTLSPQQNFKVNLRVLKFFSLYLLCRTLSSWTTRSLWGNRDYGINKKRSNSPLISHSNYLWFKSHAQSMSMKYSEKKHPNREKFNYLNYLILETRWCAGFPEVLGRQSLPCHWPKLHHTAPPPSRLSGKETI